MQHDRCHYRAMRTPALLKIASEEGINPEMAIALADALAARDWQTRHMVGAFRFNHETAK